MFFPTGLYQGKWLREKGLYHILPEEFIYIRLGPIGKNGDSRRLRSVKNAQSPNKPIWNPSSYFQEGTHSKANVSHILEEEISVTDGIWRGEMTQKQPGSELSPRHNASHRTDYNSFETHSGQPSHSLPKSGHSEILPKTIG